uniref:Laminin subunit gamma-1 n=1 Tax=Anthurium amnicola TaxID=1678845 RepID=A0A1D1Z7G9_9ARAE
MAAPAAMLRHQPHPRPVFSTLPATATCSPRAQPRSLLRFHSLSSLFSPLRTSPASSSSSLLPRLSQRFPGGLPPRCGSEGRGDAGDALKGLVGEQVEALLRKEENRSLLDGLEDASRRVEDARWALADIQRQETEAARTREYALQLQSRQSQIAESQRELIEARNMVEEAERSLSSSINKITFGDALDTNETEEINKERGRLESIKVALISSIVGTLAGLPISFYQVTSSSQLVVHLVVIFISCALFGVTFRYTIRRDLDNIQLKTGTCAAFGFVRGLSAAETTQPREFDNTSLMSLAIDGAIYVMEGTFIFIFSAVALDYCFKMGFLRTFPIKK